MERDVERPDAEVTVAYLEKLSEQPSLGHLEGKTISKVIEEHNPFALSWKVYIKFTDGTETVFYRQQDNKTKDEQLRFLFHKCWSQSGLPDNSRSKRRWKQLAELLWRKGINIY